MKEYSWDVISKHSTPENLYLVVEGKVYDVTKFQHEHPGGDEFLVDQGGQDVTELFDDAGHSDEARAILKTLQIGAVKSAENITNGTPKAQALKSRPNQASGVDLRLALFVLATVAICGLFLIYPNLGSTDEV